METRQKLNRIHSAPGFTAALNIAEVLGSLGHVTVIAGGAVRDALLDLSPHDLDLATSAPPEEVERAFARTLAVGRAFGTIVVNEGDHSFEVTTFRREGPYLDGRHPEFVERGTISEDAHRRDFTVNALFYDPREQILYDLIDGQSDLKKKYLRTVGPAAQRFGEDGLRMLRAVRFVGQLGFSLDPAALAAIQDLAERIDLISVERICAEFTRLLTTPHLAEALILLRATRLGEILWPELGRLDPKLASGLPRFAKWEHAFAALAILIEEDPSVRLKAWRVPSRAEKLCGEIERLIRSWKLGELSTAGKLRAIGGETGGDVRATLQALAISFAPDLQFIEERLAEMGGNLPRAYLNGKDLLELGIPGGAAIGRILDQIYDEQLENKLGSREQALKRAQYLNQNV